MSDSHAATFGELETQIENLAALVDDDSSERDVISSECQQTRALVARLGEQLGLMPAEPEVELNEVMALAGQLRDLVSKAAELLDRHVSAQVHAGARDLLAAARVSSDALNDQLERWRGVA